MFQPCGGDADRHAKPVQGQRPETLSQPGQLLAGLTDARDKIKQHQARNSSHPAPKPTGFALLVHGWVASGGQLQAYCTQRTGVQLRAEPGLQP